jgi:hypothetical protein
VLLRFDLFSKRFQKGFSHIFIQKIKKKIYPTKNASRLDLRAVSSISGHRKQFQHPIGKNLFLILKFETKKDEKMLEMRGS